MTTTTEAPPLSEAEAEAAMIRARANHQAAKSDIETFRALAEQGREVDNGEYAAARVADELTAIRAASAERAHVEATEREAAQARESWANSVKPEVMALDANAAQAADRFTFAARELVGAIKLREDSITRFHQEAQSLGASDRIEIDPHTGVKVDHLALRHYKGRILSEIAPAFSALLTSAGNPGAGEAFRIANKGAGLPRIEKNTK